MIAFNSQKISQQINTGFLISHHVTVQVAAVVTGYIIKALYEQCGLKIKKPVFEQFIPLGGCILLP